MMHRSPLVGSAVRWRRPSSGHMNAQRPGPRWRRARSRLQPQRTHVSSIAAAAGWEDSRTSRRSRASRPRRSARRRCGRRSPSGGSPFSAGEAARPCSERPRGVRGVRRPGATAWKQWNCLCGKFFALAARLHRSKQRKPGRQRASFTLAERSCVCSTSARKGIASRYDVLAPQDARPGPNPPTAPPRKTTTASH